MANKFVSGFVVGTLATIGAISGAVLAFKKSVIEPEEEFNDKVETNRRKANRKQHSAHHA